MGWGCAIAVGWSCAIAGIGSPTAWALPGQTEGEVADWIRTNPALRPAASERLLVRKTDTAAQRFEFQASVLPPGRATLPCDANTIRSERIHFFDLVNGVSRSRLEEALRAIYGPDIARDYAIGRTIYAYPTAEMVSRATAARSTRPLLAALQGELREGEQFAYWIEVVANASGKANSGQLIVFQRRYVPKLEAELRQRELSLP